MNKILLEANNLDTYIPSPWLKNKHLMTFASIFSPVSGALGIENSLPFIIPVSNDSSILAYGHINKAINRCLILVHGLEGSSESLYIRNLAAKAITAGFNVIRLNLRNCGNTLHLTPTLYNAGQSADLIKVVYWLKEHLGQTEQYAIGYSLGGNLVLKALAELADYQNQPVKGGCAVSPSIDLAASVISLEKGLGKLYGYYFLRGLKKKILDKHRLFPAQYDLTKLKLVNSLRSFDHLYTAPDAGYKSAEEYYEGASAAPLLNGIKINTLIIAAKDDPIVPFAPFARINNSHIKLLAPDHGGHVAFIGIDKTHDNEQLNSLWSDSQIISFCIQQSKLKEIAVNV